MITKHLTLCLAHCFCKSGIIKQDPELPPDKLLNLPPPRPKNAIFEDEEKSKVSIKDVYFHITVIIYPLQHKEKKSFLPTVHFVFWS